MWTVWNEDRRCSPLAASVNQTLSLSACSAAEFNCADGGCTPLAARCDGWSDCYDEARYFCSNSKSLVKRKNMLATSFPCLAPPREY